MNLYKEKKLLSVVRKIIKVNKDRCKISSTQGSLPFIKMYKNGVCKINESEYSKCISFSDISYRIGNDDYRKEIFYKFTSLLNSFDNTVKLQFCYINKKIPIFESIEQETNSYDVESLKKDYLNYIEEQKLKGSNGMIRSKCIVITVKEEDEYKAIRKLEAIEGDVTGSLLEMGCTVDSLSGLERFEDMNYMLNSNSKYYKELNFTDVMNEENVTLSKSLVAPKYISTVINPTYIKLQNKVISTKYFNITSTELSDDVLSSITDLDQEMIVSLHIQPQDTKKAKKKIKTKITDLNSMKIEEQKKSLSAGYDMDILPGDLNTDIDSTKKFLHAIDKNDEKAFLVTITITSFEKNIEEIEKNEFNIASVLNKFNCELMNLKYQQEKAFLSALPVGNNMNEAEHARMLTSSSTAVFIPFKTKELLQFKNNPQYYGLNQLSNNIILCSRKNLDNYNALLLGSSGKGKTFSVKREIFDVFFTTNDKIVVCDPENEYSRFVKKLNGNVIDVSTTSKFYLNPLDINEYYGDGENPINKKSDFILTIMNIIVGRSGLTAKHKNIIDKAVRKIYRKYIETSDKNDIPILGDLYETLVQMNLKESLDLADALELYVNGSLNVFNHKTNINVDNRITSFNIKALGNNLKTLGMFIIQDYMWNMVTSKNNNDYVWFYMDEFHYYLEDDICAERTLQFWKRFRKYDGLPTGITQQIKDLLGGSKIKGIIDQTEFTYILGQKSDERDLLQGIYNLSDSEVGYLAKAGKGEGLLVYGENTIIPFKDKIPKTLSIYPYMTSNKQEIAEFIKLGILEDE